MFSFLVVGQSKKTVAVVVEYNYIVTFQNPSYGKVILKYLKDKSISKTLADVIPETKDGDEQNSTVYETPMDLYQSINLDNKTIVATDRIFNSKYKVTEDLPVMNWKLSKDGESKIIDKFVCNKATLSFRGRNYVAWYTPYISSQFGPWKFYGLPGLILEVYDTDNNYHWTATKINNQSAESFDFNVLDAQKVKQQLTLRQFVEKTDEKTKAFMATVRKSVSRGTVVDFGDFDKRSGPELKYEWETDKKK
ncbi:hypothetical protein GCM10011518_30570 [Flavobacterium limi]|uniref:GLPGLI family protein n=1 Tax=Flavobacterium limi TaxID=2045105 RepID=A0ABQ1UIP9_9FLAO|nr:GLPGLI family protein [Flavobacterium limi]GGF19053.1 hypothetical protein GCM10011518_30570 [Flavobacterium limi]